MQLKKSLLTIGFAVGLGLLTGHANAALLATSPLHTDSGVTNLSCQLTNVSTLAITDLFVTIYNGTGGVLEARGPITLNPNQTYQLWHLNYTGKGYCRITTALSTASQIRGNLQTHHWAGTFWEAVAHSEAR